MTQVKALFTVYDWSQRFKIQYYFIISLAEITEYIAQNMPSATWLV